MKELKLKKYSQLLTKKYLHKFTIIVNDDKNVNRN